MPTVIRKALAGPISIWKGQNGHVSCDGIIRYRNSLATLGAAIKLPHPHHYAILTVDHILDFGIEREAQTSTQESQSLSLPGAELAQSFSFSEGDPPVAEQANRPPLTRIRILHGILTQSMVILMKSRNGDGNNSRGRTKIWKTGHGRNSAVGAESCLG